MNAGEVKLDKIYLRDYLIRLLDILPKIGRHE